MDEIVRDGAQQMLAALQAEVAAYVAQFADLDENGHRLVVRNGSHQAREVLTVAGGLPGVLLDVLIDQLRNAPL